jgi:type I site-specific restriction-modification system R (restriction) subunit
MREYRRNVLTVARQLHFSAKHPNQSVDLALFVNGLPVASVELKNPMTAQEAEEDAGRAVSAPATSTTCSSPSGPWCTSPSTLTTRSWRPG